MVLKAECLYAMIVILTNIFYTLEIFLFACTWSKAKHGDLWFYNGRTELDETTGMNVHGSFSK